MKAKCCDRCGKLYKIEEIKTELILMHQTQKKYKTRTTLDLCKECYRDLKRWYEDGCKASNFESDKSDEAD